MTPSSLAAVLGKRGQPGGPMKYLVHGAVIGLFFLAHSESYYVLLKPW